MNFLKFFSPKLFVSLAILWFSVIRVSSSEVNSNLSLHGAGWIQYGQIGHSTDTLFGQNLNEKGLYSSGAQLAAQFKISEKAEANAGIGVYYGHFLSASISRNGGYAPPFFAPYVSEANYTYNFLKEEKSALFLRGGLIPFDYNPDVQNLGLYLLRGPIYPGVVISGFETKSVLPVASLLALQLHYQFGNFENDVLVTSELEYFPYFDISPAYVASYKIGSTLRVGGGVNFYHLIPITDSITSGKWNRKGSSYVDTTNNKSDTTLIAYSGTKLMINASFDLKPLFGSPDIFGKEDLKIYSEVALFGIKNSAAYKALYGDYLNRMPMMIGFNFPAFKFFDRLSFEGEYYGSTVYDDLSGFSQRAGGFQNPLPAKDPDTRKFIVQKRNDWKWSIYASRIIDNHLKISAQIANDHFRPGIYTGQGDNSPPNLEAVMMTPQDWYWMTKVAYFF